MNQLVAAALAEDAPWGDLTTEVTVDPGLTMHASVVARQAGVASGTGVLPLAFPGCRVEQLLADGDRFEKGSVLGTVLGSAHIVLKGERVALNLLSHACAVATQTARFVDAITGTKAKIIDTRKTTPGLRHLEKAAVRHGGGFNHRFSLSDAVLVKDNHLAAVGGMDELPPLRGCLPHTAHIEIEVDRLDQIEVALAAGAQTVLCDNFTATELTGAVALVAGRAAVEASGGVSLQTVQAIAATGVDLIAVGALTHGPPPIDIGLDAQLT